MKRMSFLDRVVLGGLLMLPALVWAQCPNLDFSYGTLQNWQCYYSGGSQPLPPPLPPHTIMDRMQLEASGELYDERCNVIPKVPDGFNPDSALGKKVYLCILNSNA